MKISLGAPVTRERAQLFNDEPPHLGRFTLDVEEVGSVISDEWIGHGHDLASVGGIGKHLLIAGHCRVEAYFACLRSRRTKRLAPKNRSVFKCQDCIHTRMIDARPPCSNGNGASCDSGERQSTLGAEKRPAFCESRPLEVIAPRVPFRRISRSLFKGG
jgi:hypothetical protein